VINDQCCDMMLNAVQAEDIPVFYRPRFRTWVIEQQDGLGTRWRINYCPWCGQELPADLGEERAAEIERRGLDPLVEDDDLPADLLDDQWWKRRAL
jgi:hypothetical protein